MGYTGTSSVTDRHLAGYRLHEWLSMHKEPLGNRWPGAQKSAINQHPGKEELLITEP